MKLRSLPTESQTFSESLERALARFAGGGATLIKGSAMASALALTASPFVQGCDSNSTDDTAGVEEGLPNLPGGGTGEEKSDWAQYEGTRDTTWIAFDHSIWHNYTDCGSRGGCMGIDVFLKLRVKPAAEPVLEQKRVGVVYRTLGTNEDKTALGTYFTTLADGYEEWHVPVRRRSWEAGLFTFNAWYQDGKGNTFYDDNNGEFHVAAYQGSFQALRQEWGENTRIAVTPNGVTGTISMIVADLDYDKELMLIGTTDGWQNVIEMGIGTAGEKNKIYWSEDLYSGHERWTIDLDLQGQDISTFEYALVYRHGIVNGAHEYEFWDNNGGTNYVVFPENR